MKVNLKFLLFPTLKQRDERGKLKIRTRDNFLLPMDPGMGRQLSLMWVWNKLFQGGNSQAHYEKVYNSTSKYAVYSLPKTVSFAILFL